MSNSALTRNARELAAFLRWDGEVDFVSRASLGLKVVLQALRRKSPGRVALSPIVCQDVVSAVLSAGYEPYFVDVNPDSGEVPIDQWERARQAGCHVAIVVHLYGRIADVKSVREIFNSPDCLVIDDAAQAFGSACEFGFAGTMGDIGLVSFGSSKHITSGGAAVLHKSPAIASETREQLQKIQYLTPHRAERAELDFRRRFNLAREALVDTGRATQGFVGLLADYDSTFRLSLDVKSISALEIELEKYPERARIRLANARHWAQALDQDRFVGLDYREQDVPWRYACRLPGVSWRGQQCIAEEIRKAGIETSNWYLPAHWYFPEHAPLSGAESFSREVFQFWVEPGIERAIGASAATVNQILLKFEDHMHFGMV